MALRRIRPDRLTRARTSSVRVAFLIGALLLPGTGAAAQQLPEQVLNQRVRLELQPLDRSIEGFTEPQVIRGTVLEAGADSVRIRIHDGSSSFTIANSAIAHVDRSLGLRTEIEQALVGAGDGAIYGAVQWGLFNGLRKDPSFNQSFAQSVLTGAVVGTIVGGIIGAFRPQERWERLR